MGRKKLRLTLPPLPKTVFRSKDHKGARLLEVLRAIAVENQKEDRHVFYPVRKVAHHFRVPISTVARVYGQLEDEGLLVRVRGSKTLLQGLNSGRHFSVLGFVGLPAAVSGFVTLQDYRNFFIRTRRELRSRGFGVAMVLFESHQVQSGHLARRINKHEFDTVLWYRPEWAVRNIIAELEDGGVHVIAVNDGGLPAVSCRYEIRREAAVRQIMDDWIASGVRSAVIVRWGGGSSVQEEMLQGLLDELQLPYEFRELISNSEHSFPEQLGQDKKRGIIMPSRPAALFAFRDPEGLMQVIANERVAFTGGPPSIAFTSVRDVPADIATVDWQLIAEQIVTDLISKSALDRGQTTVFEATPQMRVSLNQFAQRL